MNINVKRFSESFKEYEYTDNLKTYDSFKGNKMIMYYEDFVLCQGVYEQFWCY